LHRARAPRLIGLSATFASQFLPPWCLPAALRDAFRDATCTSVERSSLRALTEILRRPWLFEALESMIVYEGETAIVELAKCIHVGAPLNRFRTLFDLRTAE